MPGNIEGESPDSNAKLFERIDTFLLNSKNQPVEPSRGLPSSILDKPPSLVKRFLYQPPIRWVVRGVYISLIATGVGIYQANNESVESYLDRLNEAEQRHSLLLKDYRKINKEVSVKVTGMIDSEFNNYDPDQVRLYREEVAKTDPAQARLDASRNELYDLQSSRKDQKNKRDLGMLMAIFGGIAAFIDLNTKSSKKI